MAQGDWRQSRRYRTDDDDLVGDSRSAQVDQYGNPLDDGFAYNPDQDDLLYDDIEEAASDYASASGRQASPSPTVGGRHSTSGSYGRDPYDERGGYEFGGADGWGDSSGGRAQRQPGRKIEIPKRRERRRRHKGLVALVVVIAIVVGGYLAIFSPIDEQLAFPAETEEAVEEELSASIPLTPFYVLALGSDAREGDTVSRTDTMVLVRVDPLAAKLTMVSIPRDTKVEIEGYGTQKINAAYAYGGAAGAVSAVEELTGVSISHVAVVHFEELSEFVDAIGGITVEVPVDVNDPYYTGLVMSAGTYEMDGETALLFSRVRYGFATGDYQRQEDQRIVITAILSKVLSQGVLESYSMVQSMGDLVSTDMRCYDLIPLLIRFKVGDPTIYSATLPSEAVDIDGVSYVQVDSEAAAELLATVDAGGDPSGTSE